MSAVAIAPRFMNFRILKTLILGLLLAAAPALYAQAAADDAKSDEYKAPKHGIRFVVCTTGGGGLPSPLYVKEGKGYRPITISKMMPCPRIAPEKGVIHFYDSIPEKGGKNKPVPVMSISVPEAHSGASAKSICILQPRKENDSEPLAFFIKEGDFRRGGVHIINFTNHTLEMIVDPTEQFNGKEKRMTIMPRVKTRDISSGDANTWSIYGQGRKEQRMSYILQIKPKPGSTEGKRIRAGVLLTSPGVSQVSIVADHPKLKGACSLLSVQYSDEAVLNAARAKAAKENTLKEN